MTSNTTVTLSAGQEVVFAGDGVRLAGQIDLPDGPAPAGGYPLLFILHHASAPTRDKYRPFAELALEVGYAAFRWDRRGAGRSGGGGKGSTTQDAVCAYEIALEQAGINRRAVVILALGAGTALLGSSFGLFARAQRPAGAMLISNQLDDRQILALDTRLLLISGSDDWNTPAHYAVGAARAHRAVYRYGAESFIAPNADRMLQTEDGLHPRACKEIQRWLSALLQTSAFA